MRTRLGATGTSSSSGARRRSSRASRRRSPSAGATSRSRGPRTATDSISSTFRPDRTGISTQKFENMGRMGISTGALTYDDARVPEKYPHRRGRAMGSSARDGGVLRRPDLRLRGLHRRGRAGARDRDGLHPRAAGVRPAARQVRGHPVRAGRPVDPGRGRQVAVPTGGLAPRPVHAQGRHEPPVRGRPGRRLR